MKKYIYALLWFLVLAIIALIFHFFIGEHICGVCYTSNIAKEKVEVTSTDEIQKRSMVFAIADTNGNTLFEFPESFTINASGDNVFVPESMQGIKDSIFNFLNLNQNKELLISAKYLEREGEPIGINRANFLKNFLVKNSGINPSKIIPEAVLSDYAYDDEGHYYEGVAMLFRNQSDETKRLFEQSITNKTLYSNFASTEFKPDRNLQAYAFELKQYLEAYPEVSVSIRGHTDNVGSASSNYRFGLQRAQNVADYLASQGIAKSKMSVDSKGEEKPIASNDTEEGRAKNRRITISIK